MVFAILVLLAGIVGPAVAKESLPSPVPDVRKWLELLEIKPAQISAEAAELFAPEGDKSLWRWLWAAKRCSRESFDRWKLSTLTTADLASGDDRYLGQIVAWSGTVERVDVVKLPKEVGGYGFSQYFRCQMQIGDDHSPVDVFALDAPHAWRSDTIMHERASVVGFLARLPTGDDGVLRPALVARRVAWYPNTVLGDLGMDEGLFDELSARLAVTADDRECFYQLLAAVGRSGPRQLLRFAGNDVGVEPLFNRPDQQRGKLFALSGTVRQAVLVRVDDPDIRARFGLDHYYEIGLFTNDSQGNPLTFCVRDLPPGFPQTGQLFEPVRIAGFYLKRWSYRLRQPVGAEDAPPRRQLSPLLIGRAPVWLEPPTNDSRIYTTVFIGVLVLFTGALWLAVWRWNRSGQKFHKQVLERFSGAAATSLNEAGFDDQGRPDFSNLD